MTAFERPWVLLLVFGLLVAATRLPVAPDQLFSFDDVNFVYALGHYDVRLSQPHPPGYPLFILEMHVLSWLRFKRPESILLALALISSTLALVLVARCGNRMLGGSSGLAAAWLLLCHPVFWHGGVTSGLRPHMALISVGVGAACYQAWSGRRRWILWSALILGLGAGVRPELGGFLFPLWVAGALRCPASWRYRLAGLGALATVVLAWLVPTMMASGGPATYLQTCWDYLRDQASLTSGLLGAEAPNWRANLWRFVVWTFAGVLAWPLAAVLAWRRGEGFGLPAVQAWFLVLWLLPSLLFAAFVHLEDASQALAMVPIVCLVGGYLVNRAVDNMSARVSQWHALVFLMLPTSLASGIYLAPPRVALALIPVISLAAGLLMKRALVDSRGLPARTHAMAFLLVPSMFLNAFIFLTPIWYYKGSGASGFRAILDQAWTDIHSALARSSLGHVRAITGLDDRVIGEVRRLASQRPSSTVLIWERGQTSWRKIAYYLPELPVLVLDHRRLAGASPAVATFWRGSRVERRIEGQAPLVTALPAADRIIWILNPATEFFRSAKSALPLTPSGPAYYVDLPQGGGSSAIGEYVLVWRRRS